MHLSGIPDYFIGGLKHEWQPTCNERGWDARSFLVWCGGRNKRLRKKRILEWSYDGQSVNTATQLHLLRRTRDTPFTNTLPKALERIALYLWKTPWLFSFTNQASPKRMPPLGQAFWFPQGWRNTGVAEAKQQHFFFFLRWELFWLGRALSTWELFMYLFKKTFCFFICVMSWLQHVGSSMQCVGFSLLVACGL